MKHQIPDPITCNEFREGRSYSTRRPHGSGDWLLIATLGGRGRLILPTGEPFHLQEGAIVLFEPDAFQDYSTDAETGFWHLCWSHFVAKPYWRVWMDWPEIAPGTHHISFANQNMAEVWEALERMLVSFRLGGPSKDDLAMNALEEVLIRGYALASGDPGAQVDGRVRKAMHYLATHTSEPFSLPDLAYRCGLSPSRLSHLFTDELGVSPGWFAETLKLDDARRLLQQTRLPVNQIAEEVGFVDAFYFSRRYKKVFGHAPRSERT